MISSSITDGYPLVVCEALCLGVPVIATWCTGNRDVLCEGKYGLLVDNSEEGLFIGLKKILNSPQLYKDIKKKALLGKEEITYEERIKLIKDLIKKEEDKNV